MDHPSTTTLPAPTLELVRSATDRHVVATLIDEGDLTRADLARRTNLSKPTVSESVRRLEAAGLVVEGGKTSGGPGRAGTIYRLGDGIGRALAIHAGPGGVVAQALDVRGAVTGALRVPLGVTVTPAELADALREAARLVPEAAACVVSVADPVGADGRTVDLDRSPFVRGSADVAAVLPDAVVGNDVNWAALAELVDGAAEGSPSFLYVYLGSGIGGAVVDAGRVLTGANGLAGELAYVPTAGRDGRAASLLDVLVEEGLVVEGTAIDEQLVRDRLAEGGDVLVRSLAGVVGAAGALLGLTTVVLGGPWSDAPGLAGRLADAVREVAPTPVAVVPAAHGREGALRGARHAATDALRAAVRRRLEAPLA